MGREPKGKKSFRALVAHWLTFGTAGFFIFFLCPPPREEGEGTTAGKSKGECSEQEGEEQQQEQGEGLALAASLNRIGRFLFSLCFFLGAVLALANFGFKLGPTPAKFAYCAWFFPGTIVVFRKVGGSGTLPKLKA
jgi:hypothetical protein